MKGPGRIWLDGVRHLPSPNADERPRTIGRQEQW